MMESAQLDLHNGWSPHDRIRTIKLARWNPRDKNPHHGKNLHNGIHTIESVQRSQRDGVCSMESAFAIGMGSS